MASLVCTAVTTSPRAMPAEQLAEVASGVFGADRVRVASDLADAIEQAVALADASGPSAGVLIAGSVYAAGEARALLAPAEEAAE
jgi:dihydrofolate synthase/folylpolyglutamate synthase